MNFVFLKRDSKAQKGTIQLIYLKYILDDHTYL